MLRGCYRFGALRRRSGTAQVTLLGSGAILTEVIKAAQLLAEEGIDAEVFSVTSWSELARDGQACEARALAGEADAGHALHRAAAGRRQRPGDRRHRLRARRAREHPRLPARGPALPHAGHRRLRPQRHARGAAPASSASMPRASRAPRGTRWGRDGSVPRGVDVVARCPAGSRTADFLQPIHRVDLGRSIEVDREPYWDGGTQPTPPSGAGRSRLVALPVAVLRAGAGAASHRL